MANEECGLDFVSDKRSEELYRPYADRIKEYEGKHGKDGGGIRKSPLTGPGRAFKTLFNSKHPKNVLVP